MKNLIKIFKSVTILRLLRFRHSPKMRFSTTQSLEFAVSNKTTIPDRITIITESPGPPGPDVPLQK